MWLAKFIFEVMSRLFTAHPHCMRTFKAVKQLGTIVVLRIYESKEFMLGARLQSYLLTVMYVCVLMD